MSIKKFILESNNENQNIPPTEDIKELADKLSQFAGVENKVGEIETEITNLKFDDKFEPISDLTKLTSLLNFTSDEGTKNYIRVGFRHLLNR